MANGPLIIDLMHPMDVVLQFPTVGRVRDKNVDIPLWVKYDGKPYDLTGHRLGFYGRDAKGVAKIALQDPVGPAIEAGRVTFKMPGAAFRAAGQYEEAWFRVEKDDQLVSSLNVKFNVLENNVEFGIDDEPYYSDVEKLIAELKNDIAKSKDDALSIISEFETKFQAEYSKVTSLSNEMTTQMKWIIGQLDVIKAKIKSSDIATKSELEQALLKMNENVFESLKQKADKTYIDNYLSKITYVPMTFADLATLKAKYPSGAKGLYITADTGHKYIWDGSSWKDCGAYQAAGLLDGSIHDKHIATGTIQDRSIGTINLSSVYNTYAFIGEAVQWNDGLSNEHIYFDKGNVAYTKKESTKRDTGLAFPVKLPHLPEKNNPLHIHLLYYTVNAETMSNNVDIWLAGTDGTPIKQIYTGDKKGNAVSLKITQEDFANLSMTTEFKILVVVHGGTGVLDVKDLRVNFSETEDALPDSIDKIYNITSDQVKELNTDKITNTLVDLTKYSRWGGDGDEDDLKVVIEGPKFTYQQQIDGDCGVVFPIHRYPNDRDLFVSFASSISGATNIGEEIYLLKSDGELIMDSATKLNNNYNLSDRVYRFSAANMRKWGITDQFYILFVTHKKGARLVISDLNVGVTNGNANLNDTINNVLNATPLRKAEKIGQIINDQNINNLTPIQIDGLQFVTYNAASTGNNILKKIYAYVTNGGVYTFETGIIDQNNLIMNASPFQITLTAGYNEIDVEDKGIKVPSGQRLFMNLDIDNYVYVPKNSADKYIPTLLQDKNHNSTNPNYPGMIMYDGGANMVPFAYDLVEQSKMDELSNHVDEVDQDVASLKLSKGQLILTKPNGDRVYVGVDDTGLFVHNIIPSKVTFIGNSLTVEDGHGSIGMAASDKDHDYYALVSKWIKDHNSSAEIQPRFTCAGWEGATTSTARQDFFDKAISPKISEDTDLVIIQLIDNVNTDAKLATFEKDAETLIKNVRQKAPHARVLWVAGWFVNESKMKLVKQACDQAGATLVDITKYKDDAKYKSYIGAKRIGIDGTEMTVTEAGVAAHPGDLGMQMIRDEIVKTISG